MNVPITIDTTELAQEFQLSRENVEQLLDFCAKEIAAAVAYNWDSQAKTALRSLREVYRRGLLVEKGGNGVAHIVLVGVLPNMIEQGASAFDMKEGFAKSNKVKHNKKGGWYLTVPMRHGTPGIVGESSVFSTIMPQSVYVAVRNNTVSNKTSVNGQRQVGTGLAASDLPVEFQDKKVRGAFSDRITRTTFDAYEHKSPIYQGLRRDEKTYENATQGQYTTFRRVSANSDKNAWIHRGFLPLNLGQKALQATPIPTILDRAIDQFLDSLQ
ncbi:MAG: hypothetical protein JHC54_15375 [Acinetobacter sp.]|nr:hypothetical protein [Acinetobacter sp.]